uniref:Ymf77 n=1 Tax=Tetrahymena malaccensis TaxID=5901 RepID=Q09F96_TETMA|nr:Ymf77 [Tetrahymena malaccensis]ABI51655.1 Ymf77 [Tetrahymena malaccensis]
MGLYYYLKNKWIDLKNKNIELNENRELLIKIIKITSYLLNFFILLIIFEFNIFLVLIFCFLFNKLFWDILTTWYLGDFLNGKLIYFELKYIKNKSYIYIITAIDLIVFLITEWKNYINGIKLTTLNKQTNNLTLLQKINVFIIYLKNSFIIIMNFFFRYFIIIYNFYNYILFNMYTYISLNNKSLNYFWIKLNTKKLMSEKITYNKKNYLIIINLLKKKIFEIYNQIILINLIFENKINHEYQELKKFNIFFFFFKKIYIITKLNILILIRDIKIIYQWSYILIYTIKIVLILLYCTLYININWLMSNNWINKNSYILNNKLKYIIYIIKININTNLKKTNDNNNIIMYNLFNINNKINYINTISNKLKSIYIVLLININNINNYNVYNYIYNLYNHITNIEWNLYYTELKILYLNSKRPWKQFKYNKSLYIIKLLDGLEYAMLTGKKTYKNKNIVKYHKKQYQFKKLPSKIEENIKIYTPILKLKFNKYISNLITIIKNWYNIKYLINIKKKYKITHINLFLHNIILLNIFKNYNLLIEKIKINNKIYNINIPQFNYKLNIKSNEIINNKINININLDNIKNNEKNIIKLIFSPIFILNWFISDICLSITYIKKKIKIKKIKKIINKIIKIYFKIKNITSILITTFKKIINLLFRKTIYLIFLISYIFHYKFSNLWNDFYILKIKKITNNNFILDYIILNKNIIIPILTISGLLLTIKWIKRSPKIYGNYLWTMTIFPIFLESHKLLYLKLFFLNSLNYTTIENLILMKFNFFYLINYKIYNIYNTASYLIIILFLLYSIKHGAFRSIYANLKATRWKFIKYPLLIITLELIKLKIVQYLTIFVIYSIIKYDMIYSVLNIFINFYNIETFHFLNKIINYYIIDLPKIKFEKLILYLIPNPYLVNFLIDLIIFFISGRWLIIYLKTYVKKDKKFVAFPLVTTELILKYIVYFYIFYYFFFFIYTIATNPNGIIFEYLFKLLVSTYVYLEIRVHKVPKKTMAWYFRQIVQLWPSTCFNLWTYPKYLYYDQQKYLLMRLKFKRHRKDLDEMYKKTELWEKRIIWAFQRDKEDCLHLFSAFCRLMQRKESMLKEFNIFDYVGWQIDWTYNYKKIHTLDENNIGDKPYTYLFKKYIDYTNVGEHYFFLYRFLYRFSTRINYLTLHFFIYKIIDYFYCLKYILTCENLNYNYNDIEIVNCYNLNIKWYHLIFKGWTIKKNAYNWKKILNTKNNEKIKLQQLKKLKLILMDFSSGKKHKPSDWTFPLVFEKEYKTNGWKMFENPEIDAVSLDWKPNFKEW